MNRALFILFATFLGTGIAVGVLAAFRPPRHDGLWLLSVVLVALAVGVAFIGSRTFTTTHHKHGRH